MAKIRVLIVDDSALMRQLITEILSADREIEVIGTAANPLIAREKILAGNPDVITLDVEMPGMDGLSFLEKLMAGRPTPTVMLSSLTEKGCATTLRALELGAVDFIAKPKIDMTTGIANLAEEIIAKIKNAAQCQVQVRNMPRSVKSEVKVKSSSDALITSTHKVIAIGASTGGTEALLHVLENLPPDSPGIVAVIHMPEGFTKSFAARLDRSCHVRVKEAEDGDRILPGHVLLAAGNFHMEVLRSGAIYSVRIFQSEPVCRHRPSVDVLFQSCARYLGANAVGVILTGMGNDGASGLLAMRRAGAKTIAQDEATCVVFGMPREAILLDAVDEVLPLGKIGDRMLTLARCESLRPSSPVA